MRRSSITCVLLILAVTQAQNGYDYNRPFKPFDQSSTVRPGGFPVTAPSGYPSGRPNAGSTSLGYPSGLQGGRYPGSNSSPTGSSTTNQGYPGSLPTGYPQGERPSQPNLPGQGASFPGKGGYEQNRPGSSGGSYPEQGTDQSGTYPGQGLGQTYPGQGTGQSYPGQGTGQNYPGQGTGQNYPGQGSGQNYPAQGAEQNYPGQGSGQSYPGQEVGQNYPGVGNGQNSQGQIGSGIPTSEIGFVPLGPGVGSQDTGAYEGGDYSAIPGEPDRDYPILTEIPETSFRCDAQAYPGYYADIEARCQVFHVCANNRTYDFICPNGTIFSQQVFVCVWWNQFDCNTAPSLYYLNANIYDYTIMGGGGLTGAGGDYSQGPQGANLQGNTGVQGSSSNFPGSFGPQRPFPGVPDNSKPVGQSNGYPDSIGSQRPTSGIPIGPQVTSAGYPAGSLEQNPSSGFPVTQGPSSGYPSNTGSQGSTGYPGSTGTQGTYAGYPGNANLQRPSAGYPTTTDIQRPSSGYPGSNGLQETSPGYANNDKQKPVSQSPSVFPGNQGSQNYQEYRPNIDSSQGYPSGKPTGPSFPPGPNEGTPSGGQGTQTGPGVPTQQPNREYLPPRK